MHSLFSLSPLARRESHRAEQARGREPNDLQPQHTRQSSRTDGDRVAAPHCSRRKQDSLPDEVKKLLYVMGDESNKRIIAAYKLGRRANEND